jgi:hypothetical protein
MLSKSEDIESKSYVDTAYGDDFESTLRACLKSMFFPWQIINRIRV